MKIYINDSDIEDIPSVGDLFRSPDDFLKSDPVNKEVQDQDLAEELLKVLKASDIQEDSEEPENSEPEETEEVISEKIDPSKRILDEMEYHCSKLLDLVDGLKNEVYYKHLKRSIETVEANIELNQMSYK